MRFLSEEAAATSPSGVVAATLTISPVAVGTFSLEYSVLHQALRQSQLVLALRQITTLGGGRAKHQH